ncbi:hypothetical protein CSB37_03875 [bacterium DOLZORAL124_38_8]|nr:MAG: hypothetical protein CSB37_03875 [bacterium DOLZORAL124_38_8]
MCFKKTKDTTYSKKITFSVDREKQKQYYFFETKIYKSSQKNVEKITIFDLLTFCINFFINYFLYLHEHYKN